jgi:hypothetical protein
MKLLLFSGFVTFLTLTQIYSDVITDVIGTIDITVKPLTQIKDQVPREAPAQIDGLKA